MTIDSPKRIPGRKPGVVSAALLVEQCLRTCFFQERMKCRMFLNMLPYDID